MERQPEYPPEYDAPTQGVAPDPDLELDDDDLENLKWI